jgi:hypothetical protein
MGPLLEPLHDPGELPGRRVGEPVGRRATLRTIQTAQAAWADALGAQLGEDDLRQAGILLGRVLEAVTAASAA